MADRAKVLTERIEDVRRFHGACEQTRVGVIRNVQLRRLREILTGVEEQSRMTRRSIRRPRSLFYLERRSIVVFALRSMGVEPPTVEFAVDHCMPPLVADEMERRRKIALPVGRFKRLMREMIVRTRERLLDLSHGSSVDQLVYDAMRTEWAVWVAVAFGKRRGNELRDLIIGSSAPDG